MITYQEPGFNLYTRNSINICYNIKLSGILVNGV